MVRAKDENLERVRVLCCETEGRELVMDVVDVFVHQSVVRRLVSEIMERVLEYEEDEDLGGQLLGRGERDLPCREVEVLGEGMEEVNLCD